MLCFIPMPDPEQKCWGGAKKLWGGACVRRIGPLLKRACHQFLSVCLNALFLIKRNLILKKDDITSLLSPYHSPIPHYSPSPPLPPNYPLTNVSYLVKSQLLTNKIAQHKTFV